MNNHHSKRSFVGIGGRASGRRKFLHDKVGYYLEALSITWDATKFDIQHQPQFIPSIVGTKYHTSPKLIFSKLARQHSTAMNNINVYYVTLGQMIHGKMYVMAYEHFNQPRLTYIYYRKVTMREYKAAYHVHQTTYLGNNDYTNTKHRNHRLYKELKQD